MVEFLHVVHDCVPLPTVKQVEIGVEIGSAGRQRNGG